ncbi:MAG: magnesium/cobalt transporter CorA [Bacteroidetes bacterium]|nr:magnesium/cobalt transporter CorA [Bacteroidota bacterium]
MPSRRISRKAGKPPGTIEYTGENTTTKTGIIALNFDSGHFEKVVIGSFTELEDYFRENRHGLTWFRVIGFNEKDFLTLFAAKFKIHELTLEDIMNVYQRPKIEETGDAVFCEINRLKITGSNNCKSEQVSLFMRGDTLITFQDFDDDFLSIIESRIESGKNLIRKRIDFLFYAVIDLVVDEYYVALEQLNDHIENIEAMFFSDDVSDNFKVLQSLRSELSKVRQSIWPVRDIMNKIHKKEITLFTKETLIYLNDTYDHVNQIIEILENLRESTLSLIDVYMSYTSNRLNDIMKVLTVISTIFMPLTFIAGVYGMNFHYMPEIKQVWGYPAALLLMIVVALGFLKYFRKKKWF